MLTVLHLGQDCSGLIPCQIIEPKGTIKLKWKRISFIHSFTHSCTYWAATMCYAMYLCGDITVNKIDLGCAFIGSNCVFNKNE